MAFVCSLCTFHSIPHQYRLAVLYVAYFVLCASAFRRDRRVAVHCGVVQRHYKYTTFACTSTHRHTHSHRHTHRCVRARSHSSQAAATATADEQQTRKLYVNFYIFFESALSIFRLKQEFHVFAGWFAFSRLVSVAVIVLKHILTVASINIRIHSIL